MNITESTSILPIASFSTVGWAVSTTSSSSSSSASASWDSSLRALADCGNGSHNSDDNDQRITSNLINVFRLAASRCDSKVAADALEWIAALEMEAATASLLKSAKDGEMVSETVQRISHLLLCHGLLRALTEIQTRTAADDCKPLLPPNVLVPARFDFIESKYSDLLGRVRTQLNNASAAADELATCRALFIAEWRLSAAKSPQDVAAVSTALAALSSSRRRTTKFAAWIAVLANLCDMLLGRISQSEWANAMLLQTATSCACTSQHGLRLRTAFLLLDTDFTEHLYLSCCPVPIARAAAAKKQKQASSKAPSSASCPSASDVDGIEAATAPTARSVASSSSTCSADAAQGIFLDLFPPEAHEPQAPPQQTQQTAIEEDECLRARLTLRVNRAKVAGFISSSSSAHSASGSADTVDTNAALSAFSHCVSCLQTAQHQVSAKLRVAFSVVVVDCLETICQLSLMCACKLLFLVQSQVHHGCCVVLATAESSAAVSLNASSSVFSAVSSFVNKFISALSASPSSSSSADTQPVVTFTVEEISATLECTLRMINQLQVAHRNCAATKRFSAARCTTLNDLAAGLKLVFDGNATCCDSDMTSSSIAAACTSDNKLVSLFELHCSSRHRKLHRLQLRLDFLRCVRLSTTGGGAKTTKHSSVPLKLVLRGTDEATTELIEDLRVRLRGPPNEHRRECELFLQALGS